jgi:prepilin-type N-terminal cleavage/methylation domain-containing protein
MSKLSYHPTTSLSHHRGFTLIEMMIVIAIILVLLSLVFLPYGYYMQRSYVERSIDTVGQGWILAHKDIRNGKLFSEDRTANKLLIFRQGAAEIESYLLSGSTLPSLDTLETNTDIKKENPIRLDSKIQIIGFSGANIDNSEFLGYYIEAPSGSGAFFTGSLIPFSSTGILLTIGYDGSDISSGRARQILLRPYLQ